jgi:hypothetical protein
MKKTLTKHTMLKLKIVKQTLSKTKMRLVDLVEDISGKAEKLTYF